MLVMAYARHQSFYLRDKWLSKGLKAVIEDPRFFYDKDGFEKIGLGKNMVQSLRFWLLATNLLEEIQENGNREHKLTNLGRFVFLADRLLQKNDTVSILHYHLVRNSNDLATVFYWYFNIYKETVTQKVELLKSFTTWVKNNEPKEISSKSLKRDIDCLIQLYTKEANEADPEDFIFSPFTKLNLMKEEPSEEGHENIRKVSPEIEQVGLVALYYVLLKYASENDVTMISVDEIINEKYLWGKVYNLSRNKVIEALNRLTNHEHFPIEYVRTNNLDNIKLPKIEPLNYLCHEFNVDVKRVTNSNGI
jgi:hypothetical protein